MFVQMYVPGKLIDTSNVIIDIGTRYYVEKVKICYDLYLYLRRSESISINVQ